MSAYRFCRTDDIPLLVDAWNRCGLPHFPDQAPLTVLQFKQEIRELGLWCSSCMVAFDGKDPIGVLIGCKRPPQTLVLRIAVHPEHLRKGHARHMLTSLSAKLAILGPPILVAEIPAENAAARALFAACGWSEERTYTDWVADKVVGEPAPEGLVVPVTVDDLKDIGLPPEDAPVAWARSRATLLARSEVLRAHAIVEGERLLAWVLTSKEQGRVVDIWGSSATPEATRLLLGHVAHHAGVSIRSSRVAQSELDPGVWRGLGFNSTSVTLGVSARATAA